GAVLGEWRRFPRTGLAGNGCRRRQPRLHACWWKGRVQSDGRAVGGGSVGLSTHSVYLKKNTVERGFCCGESRLWASRHVRLAATKTLIRFLSLTRNNMKLLLSRPQDTLHKTQTHPHPDSQEVA